MAAILFFGGSSDERLVSVASAQNLSLNFPFSALWFFDSHGAIFEVSKQNLESHSKPFENPFQPEGRSFASSLEQALPALDGKKVFLGFHGAEGENGDIQALLEKNKIPFTGSGSRSSHLCFDKVLAKQSAAAAGIPAATQMLLSSGSPSLDDELSRFLKKHEKIVIKPIANGSSVGLHIVHDKFALKKALDEVKKAAPVIIVEKAGNAIGGGMAFHEHISFMAEKFVKGRELTAGVIHFNGKVIALPPSEVLLDEGRTFDYLGKYLGQGTREITPADLTPEQCKAAQDLALKAHKALGCRGYSRTDMILEPSNALTFLETNTLPGLTKTSFLPQQLEAAGISMTAFIEAQLNGA